MSLCNAIEVYLRKKMMAIHVLSSLVDLLTSGANGKERACQCRRPKRCEFDSWVGKIPWRRAWQPTAVFLPGESHGQRSLVGYSPRGHKELGTMHLGLES